ncbi:FAD binding domain-containing protein [Janthinobacterium sp. RB2R34]|uniref:FAD binding domain-containing protein n=1 Tax=Janthinobacterium sp. RB2R34 TaxID=3424193 RepID=UPI003F223A5A
MLDPTTSRPRAIIIGGSLGGLFAAVSLRAIGWEVQVFERSAGVPDSRGGGIVLQPEVEAVFDFAHVPHAVPLGVMSHERIYLNLQDEIVSRAMMPQMQTSWNTLHGSMRRALPDGVLQAGERLQGFEQDGARVTARFASGRVEQADLLIGADGSRSTVRQQLLPGIAPEYAGYVAWRGLAAEHGLPQVLQGKLSDSFAFQQGDDHMLLEYLVPGENESTQPGQRRRNWVWYRKITAGAQLVQALTDRDGVAHAFSLPPGAMRPEAVAALRRDAALLLAPSFARLVEATPEPFVQAILDMQVPQMVFGRVLLVGDAASVPRPHTAGGAAKAAANALSLARSLRSADTSAGIDAALARWQKQALRHGMQMSEWGIALGERIMDMGASASGGPRTGMY